MSKTIDEKWYKISQDFLNEMRKRGEHSITPELSLRHKAENPFHSEKRYNFNERYNLYMERLLEKHPVLYKSLMILDIPQRL
jgi:hypothetical protein